MAGLDPATQPARVGEPERRFSSSSREPLRRVDTRRLDGTVKPCHDEIFMAFEFEPDSRGLDPAMTRFFWL